MPSKKKVSKKNARRSSMKTSVGGSRVIKDGKVVSDSNDEKKKAADKTVTEEDKTDVN